MADEEETENTEEVPEGNEEQELTQASAPETDVEEELAPKESKNKTEDDEQIPAEKAISSGTEPTLKDQVGANEDDHPEEEKSKTDVSHKSSGSDGTRKEPKVEGGPKITPEYMNALLLINEQNQLVNELKNRLCLKCEERSRKKCDRDKIRDLRSRLQKESLKLQCLIQKTMDIQDDNSSAKWQEIDVTTTVSEDNLPLSFCFKKDTYATGDNISTEGSSEESSVNRKEIDNDEDTQNFICCMLNQMEKDEKDGSPCKRKDDKVSKTDILNALLCLLRKKGLRPKAQNKKHTVNDECKDDDESSNSDLESCDMMNRLCDLMQSMKSNSSSNLSQNTVQVLCQQLINEIQSSEEKLINDNSDLECDRVKLQGELAHRDQKICDLKNKYACLQKELCELCGGDNKASHRPAGQNLTARNQSLEAIKDVRGKNMHLMLGINDMQSVVNCLKNEVESLKRMRGQRQYQADGYDFHENECENETPYIPELELDSTHRKKSKSDELAELETNYRMLLADYSLKEAEVKCLKQQLGACGDHADESTRAKKKAEIQCLREKVRNLQEKQENFKHALVEQSELLKEYHNKYQLADQSYEEQKCLLEKVEEQNRRIEHQINVEIQRVQDQFQEKLKDLVEVPALIENEKTKLSAVQQEKAEIEHKLSLVCKEYQELKRKFTPKTDDLHWQEKYKKANEKLEAIKIEYEYLKKERDEANQELQTITSEIDKTRTDAAREIAQIKEKSEKTKAEMLAYMRRIEKEISESHMTATVSIEEREKIIDTMRKQLNSLSYSFDAAQNQIRTLRKNVHQKTTFVPDPKCV